MDSESDNLFDRLVQKQAMREAQQVNESELTKAASSALDGLFNTLHERKEEVQAEDLAKFQRVLDLPTSLIIFGAFLQGIPTPLLDDPEVQAESLGELGVCLYTDSKLFGFRDAGTEVVHLPHNTLAAGPWSERINACVRFIMVAGQCMKAALEWDGCHSNLGEDHGDGHPVEFVFDGPWAGPDAKTVMGQFVKLMFSNVHMEFGITRLEAIDFEVEMRKAFKKS